eukprot:1162033-Pelagomonas_calceolata.AAC.6
MVGRKWWVEENGGRDGTNVAPVGLHLGPSLMHAVQYTGLQYTGPVGGSLLNLQSGTHSHCYYQLLVGGPLVCNRTAEPAVTQCSAHTSTLWQYLAELSRRRSKRMCACLRETVRVHVHEEVHK